MNVRELLSGRISRLPHTYRFQTAPVHKRESVAEHTFFTVLCSLFIGRWVNATPLDPSDYRWNRREKVDLAVLLEKAVLHDIEECKTGDIIRPFKHSSPGLKEALDYAGAKAVTDLLVDVLGEGPAHQTFYRSWANAKDDTPEGRIVQLADFMSVLGHMWWEIRCGNFALWEEYQTMADYAIGFSDPKFDFLRPIVNDVQEICRDLFQSEDVRRVARLCQGDKV